MELSHASRALEGMPVEIYTDSTVLVVNTDPFETYMPEDPVGLKGTWSDIGFTVLSMDPEHGELSLSMALDDTIVWRVDRPRVIDYSGIQSYSLISGTHQIRY